MGIKFVITKGKLHIYISSWKESFKYNNKGCLEPSSSIEQTEYYNYNISIDLYNSSRETKIMRNISIIFTNNKTVLFESIPKDNDTKSINYKFVHYDDVFSLNIPAKSVIHIDLHEGIRDNSLVFMWNVDCVYL